MSTPPQPSSLSLPAPASKRKWRMTRRGFLIGAGIAGVGLAIGIPAATPMVQLQIAESLTTSESSFGSLAADPFAWFEVLPDSRIRLYLTKVEMGQGIHTALAQIAAEDLGIAWADLDVVQANTDQGQEDINGTTGSNSVVSSYTPLRRAAATLHTLLRNEAARVLNQPVDKLSIAGRAFVVTGAADQQVDFATLAANHTAWQELAGEPILKPQDEFTVIGQSLPRVDIPAKVQGQAIYGYDVRVENLHYGAIARAPMLGATLKSSLGGEAFHMDGVKKVVLQSDFAGVVATSRAKARAAMSKLQVEWAGGQSLQQAEIEAHVTVGLPSEGIAIQAEGNAGKLLRDSDVTHRAEYRSPLAIHAPLEAQAGLADVQPDRVRVWTSTQSQFRLRQYLAQVLGVKEEIIVSSPPIWAAALA